MTTAPRSAVLVCPIGRHSVVVHASRVSVIRDVREASPDGGVTDLASILQVDVPEGPRRALLVQAEGPPRWLLIGESVSVRQLSADAFVQFPEWLRGSSAVRAFVGLVAVDSAFALELDVEQLVRGEAA